MRRLVAWIVDGLPFDDRSRRAIDETLLDWACEAGTALTTFRRLVVGVRALASVVRVTALGAARDSAKASYRGVLARFAVLSVVPALLLAIWTYVAMPREWYQVATLAQRVELSLLPVLHEFEILLPILLFVAMVLARRRGLTPTLGHAASVALGVAVFALLLEPWSNTVYLQVENDLWRIAQPPHTIWTWAPGRSFAELYSPVSRNIEGLFFGLIAFKAGLACLAGAMILFAAAVPNIHSRLTGAALLGTPLLYVGAVSIAMAFPRGDSYLVFAEWMRTPGLVVVAAALLIARFRTVRARLWLLAVPVGAVAIGTVLLPDDWWFLYSALVADKMPILIAIGIACAAAQRLRSRAREQREASFLASGAVS